MPSDSVLRDILNRLGGRQQGPAARTDLLTRTPHDLPVVLVTTDMRTRAVDVVATNVAALMEERAGDERAVFAALTRVVAHGAYDESPFERDALVLWTTRHPKTVAAQAVQWALDHPEAGLSDDAFRLARALLD